MPSASSLFLLFSVSENLLVEIFSELHENLRGIFIRKKEDFDQRATWGPPKGQGRPLAAAPPGPAGGALPCPMEVASAPLDPYKLLFALILLGR